MDFFSIFLDLLQQALDAHEVSEVDLSTFIKLYLKVVLFFNVSKISNSETFSLSYVITAFESIKLTSQDSTPLISIAALFTLGEHPEAHVIPCTFNVVVVDMLNKKVEIIVVIIIFFIVIPLHFAQRNLIKII
tara:strand:- start:123 stop:521 length:399 start_codon:yes stop_codon:yes gene_type:complete